MFEIFEPITLALSILTLFYICFPFLFKKGCKRVTFQLSERLANCLPLLSGPIVLLIYFTFLFYFLRCLQVGEN